jgi:hypothetical protein
LSFRDALSEQWIDLRLIAGMRVVLGTSALLISVLSRAEARPWAVPIDVALVLYSLYGLLIYHLSLRRNPVAAHKLIAWLDLVWYLPLIALTGTTNGTFYFFFFFSIVVASFSWGLREGLRLTLASAIICTFVGIINAPRNSPLLHDQLMLAPIGLLTFGYLIARWGGYHTQLKNRLKLLKDVTAVSNRSNDQGDPRECPRFLRRRSMPARDSGQTRRGELPALSGHTRDNAKPFRASGNRQSGCGTVSCAVP